MTRLDEIKNRLAAARKWHHATGYEPADYWNTIPDLDYLVAEVERLEKVNSDQYEAAKRGECPSCGFDNVKILEGE